MQSAQELFAKTVLLDSHWTCVIAAFKRDSSGERGGRGWGSWGSSCNEKGIGDENDAVARVNLKKRDAGRCQHRGPGLTYLGYVFRVGEPSGVYLML